MVRSGDPEPIEARSTMGRVALTVKVLAVVVAMVFAVMQWGPVAAVLLAAGGLALAALTQRRKADSTPGAVWTAAGDLLISSSQFPGQLSVSPNEIVWLPSRHSQARGIQPVRANSEYQAVLRAGPALADVFLVLTSPEGHRTTILSRRSRHLAAAIGRFRRHEA